MSDFYLARQSSPSLLARLLFSSHPLSYDVPPSGAARLFMLHAIHAWVTANEVLLPHWTNTATAKRPVAYNSKGDHNSLLL
jgi:hypothetical protein